MSLQQFHQAMNNVRREALISNYLSLHDFGNHNGSVNNADDLYEYLLLDTEVSELVTTTKLGEAISSLQLYIHRAIEGYDGEMTNASSDYFSKDSFLYNWDMYNKRYSTWAGKEKLRFYAGNYVDPTLRSNRTALFDSLSQRLNQGKLTDELVAEAVKDYISQYDNYIAINQLYVGYGNDDGTILYITGELDGQYYWREVERDSFGKPIRWGEWNSIPFPINDPEGNKVVVSWNPALEQLVCEWYSLDREQQDLDPNATSKLATVYNVWALSINNQWKNRTISEHSHDIETLGNLFGYVARYSEDLLMVYYQKNNTPVFQVDPPSTKISNLLKHGMSSLFDYEVQKDIAEQGVWRWISNHVWQEVGNGFSGCYGLYLWEIFFHIPFLIASSLATEQRFEEAETWYKYLFSSVAYRDDDGNILNNDEDSSIRYWNVYPLEKDTAWDEFLDVPATVDPDIIAQSDPMHYKLSVFLRVLELLLSRGDACYRQLDRGSLTEAKMHYMQARQLLGPSPDIRLAGAWHDPTLADESRSINLPSTRTSNSSLTFHQWFKSNGSNDMGDGDFLPPYNEELINVRDKIEIRLYNLRNNLSLDGQPLSLSLYSSPVSPNVLYREQGAGNGTQSESILENNYYTGWRYPLLSEHARNGVAQLTQFGSSLLSALERRDTEQLAMLFRTQKLTVLKLQQDIAQSNLDSLNETLNGLNISLASAGKRQDHYQNLIDGDLSAAEVSGLNARSQAIVFNIIANSLQTPAGILSAMPNTFGLACGGGDYGAPLAAGAQIMQMVGTNLEQSATVSEIAANYQRRREEWILQRDLASDEVQQLSSQVSSLDEQIVMQRKQLHLTETESAHTQAEYDLKVSQFTGEALYSWMTGRLSSLYYQMYDATMPICLQARNSLAQELGADKTEGLFNTSVWSDLYQGLLAGEALSIQLQKLDNIWLLYSAQGLEVTRTVSIATVRGETSGNLNEAITGVLSGTPDSADNGILTQDDNNRIFSAFLDMSKLNIEHDYSSIGSGKRFFIKSIAVTLPTILGPYQDIAATLSDQHGNLATLSHCMQDNGRFVTNFEDPRFLPFEGSDPTASQLTLAIYNVQMAGSTDTPNQRLLVEELSDVIFHVHYIMR